MKLAISFISLLLQLGAMAETMAGPNALAGLGNMGEMKNMGVPKDSPNAGRYFMKI